MESDTNEDAMPIPKSQSSLAAWTLAWLAIPSPFLWAQSPPPLDWPTLIEKSNASLDPTRLPDPAPSRRNLESALKSLDSFLTSSETHGPRWKSFLRWDALQGELQNPSPNLELLNDIEKRFRQNYRGLEMPQFTAVREAIGAYVATQRLASNPETTMQIFRNRLGRLNEKAQVAEMHTDSAAMHELAQTLSYLHQGNQAPELVSAVRSAFSAPNVRVLVAKDFVTQRFALPVQESNPVNELILGTTIRGQSWISGSVAPQLLDSPTHASLRMHMMGDFSSINRGYNRSVVLDTQGQALVFAGESIALTSHGLVSNNDTIADADLQTSIQGIHHKLKLVRKVAAKQAAKQKPLADAIGESRLETRLRRQFHQQLTDRLAEVNQRLESAGRTELTRLGISKPERSSWSSTDFLGLQWNVRSGVQLAAFGACPHPIEPSGLTVQIHQSFLGNLLHPVLAGRILRSEEMDGYVSQFGKAAKGIQRNPEDGPWSITMNGFQPVELLLDDARVRFRIRTEKLEREDQALEQSAVIDAAYRVEIVEGAVQLHREGDVNVEFSGRQQKGVRSVTLRTFLKNKFEQLFRPQLLDTPVDWTERLPEKFQDLQLASLTIDDGWMQMHLK